MTLFSNQDLKAQNGFSWNSWVGCVTGQNDTKSYTELIESGECHRACQQKTITYTITGVPTAQITNTIWHVVGGTIVSTPNNSQCIVKWGTTATGAIGFTTTRVVDNSTVTLPDLCVNLTINPQAFFTIAPADNTARPPLTYYACKDQELFFSNFSTANGGSAISSYYWDFGDGTASSSEIVSHTYTQEGTYTASLKVDNQCNCSSIISYIISVQKKGVQIDCASIVCEGQKSTYTVPEDVSQSCTQFNWSVLGGTILSSQPYTRSIDVLWAEQPQATGFGYITFDPVGCDVSCYIASTLEIPIIKQSTPIVGDNLVCGTNQVLYKLPQWPTTDFEWTIENSANTNASLTFTDQRNEVLLNPGYSPGTVLLKCKYTNTLLNCGGIATPLTITVQRPADIAGASSTCVGATEPYSESSGLSVAWSLQKLPDGLITNFVGSEFSPTFTAPGDYSLTATDPDICNPASKIITVSQNATPLAADFISPLTVCPGAPIIYTFQNTIPNTKIVWQVTGGQIIGSNIGESVQIQFGLPPSSGPNYSITLSRENVNEPFCASGILTLTLALPQPLIVIKGETLTTPPKADPCASSYTNYQVEATAMDNYDWILEPANAGNITVINTAEPWKIRVLWNQVNSLTATLRLRTRKCLLEYMSSVAITISSPVITITPATTSICRGLSQTFTLNPATTIFDGTILWDFGNGQTSTTNVPTVNYTYTNVSTAIGTFFVKATITNPNGCPSVYTTVAVPVQVKVAPVAIITPTSNVSVANLAALLALPDSSRRLTANISNLYGAVSAITWFKDTAAVSPQPTTITSYVVANFGTYYAIITNMTGCSFKTNSVTFFPSLPDPLPTCPNTFNPTLTLTNTCGVVQANIANVGNPESFNWSSSNGASPTVTPNPPTNSSARFAFTDPRIYTVFYTATYNNNGVICIVKRATSITVPYIADLKYTVSCSTGATYLVKLIDNSKFYFETPIDSRVYKIYLNGNPDTTTTLTQLQITNGIALPPGNYGATLEISKNTTPSYPMCSKVVSFTLEPKPTVAFTMSSASVCPGEPVALTLTTPVNPNWTYLWTFKPSPNPITNTQPQPYVTYATFGPYQVSLKVTNQYGCTVTTPSQTITVKQATELTRSPLPNVVKCEGTTASLSFPAISGIPNPPLYKWMKGNAPAPGNNSTNPYTATTSGSYWLQTAPTINGCFKTVKSFYANVAFVDIPTPVINSTPEVCIDKGVLLSNQNNTNAPIYQNIWRRNNTVISYEANFKDYPPATGIYNYTLEVKTPLGDGTTAICSETSAPYTVNVIDAPEIIDLYYEQLLNPVTGSCNPFKIRLTATANATGTFTWSNGKSGAIIDETAGGVYQVLFTTPSGCTATREIYVPKDLTSYMWIVPKGCYTFCDEKPNQQVIGPAIQEFASWAWLKNGVANSSGIAAVGTKNLIVPGAYQLQLGDSVCTYDSTPFSITHQLCASNTDCDWFTATLMSVTTQTEPFLYYDITFSMTNTTSSSFIANLTSANTTGFFIPATVTVPPGGGTYTVSMIASSAFAGGAINFLVTAPNSNGNLCQIKLGSLPQTSNKNSKGLSLKSGSLLVYPNPATEIIRIEYNYYEGAKNTKLELYDTQKRLLATYEPQDKKGTWELPVGTFAAGMYVVAMKQNGVLVAQQNVIKQ